MRTVAWLLVIVAIGAIARAEPATGTVVVSCNEADASLLVDGVLLPERTPAVLTLPAGTHTIEARKPPLVAQKQVIQVADQQQIKVRFELVPPGPPPPAPGSDAGLGSGSGSPPATGSAAPLAGSGAPPGSGSAAPLAGSGAPPVPLPTRAPAKASRCTEGGHEVPCAQGPRCTEGGRPVPCKKGESLPPPPPTAPPIGTGSGAPGAGSGSAMAAAGSNAHAEPPHVATGTAAVEIATAVPHAVAYVDGAPVREAPCLLELEPGEHVVAVYAAGMVPAEALVRVTAGQRQRVDLTPSKPRRRIDVPAQ